MNSGFPPIPTPYFSATLLNEDTLERVQKTENVESKSMTSLFRQKRWRIPVIVLLGGLFIWIVCDRQSTPLPVATIYETPEWLRGEILLMRSEGPNSDCFLMRVLGMDDRNAWDRRTRQLINEDALDSQVLRFCAGPQQLCREPHETWKNATGVIGTIAPRSGESQCAQVLDHQTFKLSSEGRPVQAYGRSVVGISTSPDGQRLAVASSQGKPRGGLLPFMSGTTAPGRKYHEVLTCPDSNRLVGPIELPEEMDQSTPLPQWSPDGNWVIYPDAYYRFIVILPGMRNPEGAIPASSH